MLHPVALALVGNESAVVNHAVEHSGRPVLVVEYLAPSGEVDVCGDHERDALVAHRDQAEQQLGTLRIRRQIVPLVEDDHVASGELGHLPVKGARGRRSVQVEHELGGALEGDAVAHPARDGAERHRRVRCV